VENTRVMTAKLTLTVEETVISKAKLYAKATGKSVSELVENYLDSITKENTVSQNAVSGKLQNLIGSVKLPLDFDEEKELRTYHEAKHL
jgi:Family of unknown function (DUF6364)